MWATEPHRYFLKIIWDPRKNSVISKIVLYRRALYRGCSVSCIPGHQVYSSTTTTSATKKPILLLTIAGVQWDLDISTMCICICMYNIQEANVNINLLYFYSTWIETLLARWWWYMNIILMDIKCVSRLQFVSNLHIWALIMLQLGLCTFGLKSLLLPQRRKLAYDFKKALWSLSHITIPSYISMILL